MAKIYWTKDIKKLIDKKVEHDSAIIVNDHDLSEEALFRFVRDLRIFKKYADELIEEMEQLDREDDEYIARIKAEAAKRDAEKASEDVTKE